MPISKNYPLGCTDEKWKNEKSGVFLETLINLYALAQQTADINNAFFYYQYLPDLAVLLNIPIAIDTVFYGVNTLFDVQEGVSGTNYTLNNGEITFLSPGDYTVTISNPAITNSDGTPAYVVQTFTVTNSNSIENITASNIKVYPNPFAGKLYLTGAEGCLLKVITETGLILHTQHVINANETIHLDHLPAGVYFLSLEKDAKTETLKVMKQ